jgi:hypothetical protein
MTDSMLLDETGLVSLSTKRQADLPLFKKKNLFLGVQSLLKLYRDDIKLTWNGKMMKGIQEVIHREPYPAGLVLNGVIRLKNSLQLSPNLTIPSNLGIVILFRVRTPMVGDAYNS